MRLRAMAHGRSTVLVVEADPAERVTVWGMERHLTRLIREQWREKENER